MQTEQQTWCNAARGAQTPDVETTGNEPEQGRVESSGRVGGEQSGTGTAVGESGVTPTEGQGSPDVEPNRLRRRRDRTE